MEVGFVITTYMEANMGSVTNTGFGTFVFDDVLPSPAGDVPFRSLGSMTPRGVNVLCGLEAGRCYEPEKHPYSCLVIVLEGSGAFVRDGKRLSYAPGSSFRINADMFHGFVSVETATVFIKQARPSKRQPA